MHRTRYVRNRSAESSNRILWGLLAAFLLAVLLTAYLTFVFVRALVSNFGGADAETVENVPPPPTAVVAPLQASNEPLQAQGPEGRPWDGSSRVTILFMGLDQRDWEDGQGPARTDTMILFTLDPETRSAGILSIPRDLWVSVPGFENAKINTAYFLGEAYGVPGGGPGLAVQTVEQVIGIPINFYAQVDFFAFERFIDELGGIEVEVPYELSVDPIGPDNTVYLDAGQQTLDGPTSLAYARARNTAGNDFDRAQRQQQVILAIRDRILNLNMLPTLIEKSPVLYYQLSKGVHSNMSLDQIIAIAWYGAQIAPENIKRGAIGPDQVVQDYSPEGLDILRPLPDEIRLLRDEVLTVSGPIQPVAVSPTEIPGDPEELRSLENAQISVFNGTQTPGLAARTTTYLTSEGIFVTLTDNALDLYEYTTIINYSGKIYTEQYLVELLNVQPSQVFSSYDPNSPYDIAVFLGRDWAENNFLP